MPTFEERLAANAEKRDTAPVHKDVPVSFDSDLADARARLLGELGPLNAEREGIIAAAAEVLTLAPDTADVDARINAVAERIAKLDELDRENLVVVRVYRLGGSDWLDLVAGHPARVNSAIDRGVGYNVNTGTIAALVTHGRIVDGEQETTHTAETWISLSEQIAGGDFVKLVNAVFEVNVADAQQRTAALKNFSEAALASDKK